MDRLRRTQARFFTAMALMLIATGVASQTPLPKPDLRLHVDSARANVIASVLPLADGGLLVTGSFSYVGEYARANVARLNSDGTLATATYAATGPFGRMAEAGAGTVYASVPAEDLVRKYNADGTIDTSFSLAVDGIYAMLMASDGDLIIAGDFTAVNGQARPRLAKVDAATGQLRTAFTPAVPMPMLYTMVRRGDDLYVGGYRSGTQGLMKLSASTGVVDPQWQPVAQGLDRVDAIALSPDGTGLYVLGRFSGFGGQPRINLAKLSTSGVGAVDPTWRSDTSSWFRRSVAVAPDGWIHVADGGTGLLTRRDPATGQIAPNPVTIQDLSMQLAFDASGGLVASGEPTAIAGRPRTSLTWWTPSGAFRDPVDLTVAPSVNAVARQPDGGIIVGGNFDEANGLPRRSLLRIKPDGELDEQWAPALDARAVVDVAVDANGDVIVGGDILGVGGAPRNGLARLHGYGSGAAFADEFTGPGFNFAVSAMALDSDGLLYVSGSNGRSIYRFRASGPGMPYTLDDAFWPNFSATVTSLIATGGGLLYFGTEFNNQTAIRRAWTTDGNADPFWSVTTDGPVRALAFDREGALIAGGAFQYIDGEHRPYLARLPSTAGVLSTPDGPVSSLLSTANEIYIGGRFVSVGGLPRRNVARLSMTGAVDTDWHPDPNGPIQTIIRADAGTVTLGGQFHGDNAISGARRSGIASFEAELPDVIFGSPFE
ncbi:MAG TPA: hypothetical protein VLF18_14425 [Tahibacter sp.]|uniref:hypothetical protein n=1 Tax=Tahibacter sp. TaxID=2056211 RepID=UPI002C8A1FA1|nr:hypothetical protein [Tahibacter sp.]HSX61394.1 hypothetical protein [Tahibacter sp.]